MSSSIRILAERYANSFFLAIKDNNFEENYKNFCKFVKVWNDLTILRDYLTNPAIQIHKKIELVNKIFNDELSAINNITRNFINLLINKNRIQYLNHIYECLEEKVHDHLGYITIKVLSAVALTEEEKEALKFKLTKHNIDYNKIFIENIVKPELIGGLLIYYKNKIIDTTIRTRLSVLLDKISELEYKISII